MMKRQSLLQRWYFVMGFLSMELYRKMLISLPQISGKNRQPYIDRMYEVYFNVVFKSQVTMHVQYVKDTTFFFVYVFNNCNSLPYFLSMHKSNRCHLHSGNCLHFIFILIRTGFCVAQFWIFYFVFARLFRLFSSVLCCFPTIFFFCYSHSCILSQWHSKPCKFFNWWITLLC